MAPIDIPPKPAIVRLASDYQKKEKAEAERRRQELKRAMEVEARRKASETSQKK